MEFILDKLEHGWLDCVIRHNGQELRLFASNMMGGDLVRDTIAALCEVITDKTDCMVVFSYEDHDEGLLFRHQADGTCDLLLLEPDNWDNSTVKPRLREQAYYRLRHLFKSYGVFHGFIPYFEGFRPDTLTGITEAQLINLARALLSTFSRFNDGKGNLYYHSHWIFNSDGWGPGIPAFPIDSYNRLMEAVGVPDAESASKPTPDPAPASGSDPEPDRLELESPESEPLGTDRPLSWDEKIDAFYAVRYGSEPLENVIGRPRHMSDLAEILFNSSKLMFIDDDQNPITEVIP